ncbi:MULTISPECIES: amino acid ABC transporter ATP-binding protein [Gluconacetobacter]|uniref:Amino acid ABC transporter ATP-binding protein n=2 Tax=Gluconacetobacter TaxID=89583 RepID=A0A370G3A1_GLULI|nr:MULTISPECIES: amino acid ABC transporter ATP-binding protein [Gluconacetobacter]GBQ98138.1 amino acid transporter ATP-binding protein [Gluconacetobacter liquefaciens NRIC 0522]MBB2187466.1 amino acid ABC transporter ATP-binding protein [Gluconacetobacter liquefaciens]MBB2198004.1 amino acid ABC transporter ATP-binding protein [Gluconacetobacter dulcium]RDI37496.1 amino acid ABC transporter ATP-binding protein (PAAT family) [Gluconacetobacter liquefaciens]GEB38590.1 ABC transporter ATP-bindi
MQLSTSPDPTARISIRGLSKFYKDYLALDRVDLDVRKGERIVVLGPSGSGKSTFIRCLNRIEPHDSGVLMIDGRVIDDRTDLTALRGSVGMVFQNYNLFPHLSVLDNCTLAPRLVRGVGTSDAEATARRYLSQVNIAEQADKFPIQLSGGQQQRVAIARALCMNPEIILFDEPTAALDPESISGIVGIMRDLTEQGITTVCVTHEMGFARHIADRIVFMDRGAVLEITPPEEFFTAPRTERARTFLAQMIRH